MASKNQHGGAWLLARQCFVERLESVEYEKLYLKADGATDDRLPSDARHSTRDPNALYLGAISAHP